MENSKIGTKEAIYIILSISIAHTILSMPRNILLNTKSAVILNLVFVCFILIGISIFVVKLFKNFPRFRYIGYFGIPWRKEVQENYGLIFHCIFYNKF